MATWLARRGLGPGEVTVGSKWGYTYTADWRVDASVNEVKDLSVGALRRQLAESEQLLGPNLRLYQIHSATLESGVIGRPAAPRPWGKRAGSRRSKQMRWPVRGQTEAQAQSRFA